MKAYSTEFNRENCACARVEDINASFKDLSQVCGNIRRRNSSWALEFLRMAAKGEAAVRYRKHNKRLAHRRELGGKKGRYPRKAAGIVLKLLESAIANGMQKGLGETYRIIHVCATKKHIYPRLAPKGRMSRSFLETARVEMVLSPEGEPEVEFKKPAKKPKKPEKPMKKVEEKKKETKAPAKKEVKKPEAKTPAKKEESKKAEPEAKKEKPEEKKTAEQVKKPEKKKEEPVKEKEQTKPEPKKEKPDSSGKEDVKKQQAETKTAKKNEVKE